MKEQLGELKTQKEYNFQISLLIYLTGLLNSAILEYIKSYRP